MTLLGGNAGLLLLKEHIYSKSTMNFRRSHIKKDIAHMLEDEDLEETLDLNDISIIPGRVYFYNENLRKCTSHGDYILVRNKDKLSVIRQYRDYDFNVKVEVLDPDIEEDMKILEQDAPEVCESIKKLRLK